MTPCNDMKHLLVRDVTGNASEEEQLQITKHVSECVSCKTDYAQFQKVWRWGSSIQQISLGQNHRKTMVRNTLKSSKLVWYSIAAAIVLCLVSVWFVINQSHDTNNMNQAVAQVIDGKVTISDNLIRTAEGEKGSVKLLDKTVIEVNQNTQVEVKKLDQTTGTVLELTQGSANFNVNKQEKSFTVKTPAAEVSVLGTKFLVVLEFVNSKGEKAMKKELLQGVAIALLLVSVESGSVYVSNIYGSEKLTAGEKITVRQDKAPEENKQTVGQDNKAKTWYCGSCKKEVSRDEIWTSEKYEVFFHKICNSVVLSKEYRFKLEEHYKQKRCAWASEKVIKHDLKCVRPQYCSMCFVKAVELGLCSWCGEKIIQDQKEPDIQKLIDDLGSKDKKTMENATKELIQKVIESFSSKDRKEQARMAKELAKLSAVSSQHQESVLKALKEIWWLNRYVWHLLPGRACVKCGRKLTCDTCPKKKEHMCPTNACEHVLQLEANNNLLRELADKIQKGGVDLEQQLEKLFEKPGNDEARAISEVLHIKVKLELNKLDSDDPKVRDEATREIIRLGKEYKDVNVKKMVEEELKKAEKAGNAEVESRCKKILEELKKGEISEEDKKWIKDGKCIFKNPTECAIAAGKKYTSELIPCPRCQRKAGQEYRICEACADELGICAHCQKKK